MYERSSIGTLRAAMKKQLMTLSNFIPSNSTKALSQCSIGRNLHQRHPSKTKYSLGKVSSLKKVELTLHSEKSKKINIKKFIKQDPKTQKIIKKKVCKKKTLDFQKSFVSSWKNQQPTSLPSIPSKNIDLQAQLLKLIEKNKYYQNIIEKQKQMIGDLEKIVSELI